MMRIRNSGIYFLLFSLIVFLDRITKFWVLSLSEPLKIFSFFSIKKYFNKGISFGFLGQEKIQALVFFAIIILMIVLCYLIYKRFQFNLGVLGEVLVLAGALGNFSDRICYGAVLDFIALTYKGSLFFPAFNIADIAICLGAAIMLLRRDK